MKAKDACLGKTYMPNDDPVQLKDDEGNPFTPPGPILIEITGHFGWPDHIEASIVSEDAHFARRVLVPGDTELTLWT